MRFSEERPFFLNALFFVFSIAGLFIVPYLVGTLLSNFTDNLVFLEITANITLILLVYLMYAKDLNREAKSYFSNFKKNFEGSIKYYVLGLVAMIVFNLLIALITNSVSDNESLVREMLFETPIFTMLSIIIIAPLSEELIFRKSLAPIIKNKWVYATISALLFGSAHLIAGEFVLTDLLFLLPYGSLGFAFAVMDYESKSTWNSIVIHAVHNGLTGVLLLITYYAGLL